MPPPIKQVEISTDITVFPEMDLMMSVLPSFTTSDILNNSFRRTEITTDGKVMLAPWGSNDCFPEDASQILDNDRDAPMIIENKVNFLVSNGIRPYTETENEAGDVVRKRVLSGPVYRHYKTWKHIYYEEFEKMAYNFERYGNGFCEIIFDLRGRVVSIRNVDAHYIRCVNRKKGDLDVKWYALKTHTDQYNVGQSNYEYVPSIKNLQPGHQKYIFQLRRHDPGQPYYSKPIWYGATRDLMLQSLIMDAQLYSLKNGWNIKYHMEVDEAYFNKCKNDTERKAKKQQLVKELNTVLSGVSSYDTTLVTEMVRDHLKAKMISQVKITVIDDGKSDDKLNKLSVEKSAAQTRAFNIDLELAGIPIGGNLSSGTEIRTKYLAHILLKTTPVRNLFLKIPRLVHTTHGFSPEIEYEFVDYQLTKLDDDSSGTKTLNE